MRWVWTIAVGLSLGLAACSRALPFSAYQQEIFPVTPITTGEERVIRLTNSGGDQPQHVRAIAFDAGGNVGGHFTIKGVRVGGKTLQPKDVIIPPGAAMELVVEYTPKNLDTTVANFGGWETGQPVRYIPGAPPPVAEPAAPAPSATAAVGLLIGARHAEATEGTPVISTNSAEATPPTVADEARAIHRALIVMVYDFPKEGVVQIELVGSATPGPNGETTATGGGGPVIAGECQPGPTTACFEGEFQIGLPELMEGEQVTGLSGPVVFHIESGNVTLNMAEFPTALFVLEDVPSIPVGAISLAISGDGESVATGTFDGAAMNLSSLGFRVRFYLGKVSMEELAGTSTPFDFFIRGLTLTTVEPLTDGTILLGVETTLGQNPANNPTIDGFLAGKKVIVKLKGTLIGPSGG